MVFRVFAERGLIQNLVNDWAAWVLYSRGLISGAARGGGTLSECMIQSSHRFGLAASSPNLSESSLARWAPVLGFVSLTLGPFGEPSQPTRQTGFRQIWLLAVGQTGWLD